MISFRTNTPSLGRPEPVKTTPHFGCRMFVYYTSEPGCPGQDKLIRQHFADGGNSMERQEQLKWSESGDLGLPAIKDFKGRPPGDPTEKAGWSLMFVKLTSLGEAVVKRISDYLPIHKRTELFHSSVEQVASNDTILASGFIRERDPGKIETDNPENCHPLRPGNADWSLMHHGDITPPLTAALDEKLQQLRHSNSEIPLPKTEVDSERYACYLAARFYEKYGSTNISHLTDEQIQGVLKTTINEFRNWPGMESWSTDQQNKARTGTLNLIITDDKNHRVFGVRDGAPDKISRAIFVGSYANKRGNQVAFFNTDPFQFLDGSEPIKWKKVPYHSVFSLNLPEPVKAKDEIELKTLSL